MKKLLPCPFCGGEAEIAESEESFIRCRKCGIESPSFYSGGEKQNSKNAVKYWNTRIEI